MDALQRLKWTRMRFLLEKWYAHRDRYVNHELRAKRALEIDHSSTKYHIALTNLLYCFVVQWWTKQNALKIKHMLMTANCISLLENFVLFDTIMQNDLILKLSWLVCFQSLFSPISVSTKLCHYMRMSNFLSLSVINFSTTTEKRFYEIAIFYSWK